MAGVEPVPAHKWGRRVDRYVLVKALQAVGLVIAAFVLLRVVGPWLVDLHSTPALILAAVLLIAGAFVIVWFSFNLLSSLRRRRDRRSPTARIINISRRDDPHA